MKHEFIPSPGDPNVCLCSQGPEAADHQRDLPGGSAWILPDDKVIVWENGEPTMAVAVSLVNNLGDGSQTWLMDFGGSQVEKRVHYSDIVFQRFPLVDLG
jgi:hypothetical protein